MATLTHEFPSSPAALPPESGNGHKQPNPGATGLQVIRRNGTFSPFDAGKITLAITKAFVAVEGSDAAASHRIRGVVESLTEHVVETLSRRAEPGRPIHIEDVQ